MPKNIVSVCNCNVPTLPPCLIYIHHAKWIPICIWCPYRKGMETNLRRDHLINPFFSSFFLTWIAPYATEHCKHAICFLPEQTKCFLCLFDGSSLKQKPCENIHFVSLVYFLNFVWFQTCFFFKHFNVDMLILCLVAMKPTLFYITTSTYGNDQIVLTEGKSCSISNTIWLEGWKLFSPIWSSIDGLISKHLN